MTPVADSSAPPAPAGGRGEDRLAPGTEVGEFVIERRIAAGGMGTIYLATHPVIGKRAAIKVISRALADNAASVVRFVREARVVNEIRHPNIVEAFSIGELPDGRAYYAMEWLDGMSLSARLKLEPIPFGEALVIIDEIADALLAVHARGIVHRDLKPSNVFLVDRPGRYPQVKLIDFGVAKEDDPSGDHTATGLMIGTPIYAPPEQLLCVPIDHRADLYSLGCVAYQLLTRHVPYENEDGSAATSRKLLEPPTPPTHHRPDLPAELEAVLLGLLAYDPASRPPLVELRALLARLFDQQGTGSFTPVAGATPSLARSSSSPSLVRAGQRTPPPHGSAPRPATRADLAGSDRRRRWWIVGGMAAAATGVGVLLLLGPWRPGAADDASAARPDQTAPRSPQPALATVAPAPAPAAAPTAAPAPAMASLRVRVDVDGARIELDGKLVAEASREVVLPVTAEVDHDLVVTAGPRRAARKVRIAAGVTGVVELALQPPVRHRRGDRGQGRGPARSDPDYLLPPD